MIGSIIIWSGLESSIPPGWQLCNGTNGTPDLRNRFVRCAQTDGDLSNQGGATTHTHAFTSSLHSHAIVDGPVPSRDVDLGTSKVVEAKTVSGTSDSASSNPLYYKLFYIMRIS